MPSLLPHQAILAGIFYNNKRTNLHLWLWFPLHFQLIVECLSCSVNGGGMKGEYLVYNFFGLIWSHSQMVSRITRSEVKNWCQSTSPFRYNLMLITNAKPTNKLPNLSLLPPVSFPIRSSKTSITALVSGIQWHGSNTKVQEWHCYIYNTKKSSTHIHKCLNTPPAHLTKFS